MDVIMPLMDGIETCKKLRKINEIKHIPIILMTAYGKSISDMVVGLESGADDYLHKPINRYELIARIKSLLRLKKIYDENKKLLNKITTYNKNLEMELATARNIQMEFLPKTFPYPDRISVWFRYLPTKDLSGDFYEILDLSDNKALIVIGDVSGSGASAALIVSIIRTLININRSKASFPKDMVKSLNQHLIRIIPSEYSVTLFYGVLDINTLELSYVTAGHPAPFLIRFKDEKVLELGIGGPLLGMFDSYDPHMGKIQLNKRDRLFTYSDGLYKNQNGNKRIFGRDRLRQYLENTKDHTFPALIDNILNKTSGYSVDGKNSDDVAILGLEVL